MSTTGYARVSTADQDPTSQIEALRAAGCDPIYIEHASGATMERSQWSECNRGLGRGDTLVVVRIDRLGRSLTDLVSTLDDLGTRGVHFRSLTEGIDTSTALGRMFYQLAGAFAEYERTLISERTRRRPADRSAADTHRRTESQRPTTLCPGEQHRSHSKSPRRFSCDDTTRHLQNMITFTVCVDLDDRCQDHVDHQAARSTV